MALKYHMEEAIIEKELQDISANPCPQLAIFSKKYYNDIKEINYEKNMIFVLLDQLILVTREENGL